MPVKVYGPLLLKNIIHRVIIVAVSVGALVSF